MRFDGLVLAKTFNLAAAMDEAAPGGTTQFSAPRTNVWWIIWEGVLPELARPAAIVLGIGLAVALFFFLAWLFRRR